MCVLCRVNGSQVEVIRSFCGTQEIIIAGLTVFCTWESEWKRGQSKQK